MATLEEIRKKYPQYADVPDAQLADGLYKKHYAGKIDRAAFDKQIGLSQQPVQQAQPTAQPINAPIPSPQQQQPQKLNDRIAGGMRDFADGNIFPPGIAESAIDGITRGGAALIDDPVKALKTTGNALVVNPAKSIAKIPHNLSLGLGNLGQGAERAIRGDTTGAKQQSMQGVMDLGQAAIGGADALTLGRGGTVGRSLAGAQKSTAAVPSTEGLLGAAKSTRAELKDMGVTYSPEQLKQLANGVTDDIPISGIDAAEGIVAKQAKKLSKHSKNPATLDQLDKLRQRAAPAKTASNQELRDAGLFKDHIDDFMQKVDPALGGSKDAKGLLDTSRDFTRRGRNAERIEGLVEKAKDGAAGTLGGVFKTQDKFRGELKNFMGRKEFNFLKKHEQDAVRKLVRGNAIDVAARAIGKFQPTGFASAGFGGVAAATNPMLASVPIAGTIGRQVADHRTRKATKDLIKMIQSGAEKSGGRIPLTAAQKADRIKAQMELISRLPQVGAIEQSNQLLTGG